jgi:CheY-like chemotaxis protein
MAPAVIILDIWMPGTNGWQALKFLKSDKMLADCPVVLLTISDDFQRGRELGVAGHLVKPVDRDALAQLLARLCPREEEDLANAAIGAPGGAPNSRVALT